MPGIFPTGWFTRNVPCIRVLVASDQCRVAFTRRSHGSNARSTETISKAITRREGLLLAAGQLFHCGLRRLVRWNRLRILHVGMYV